jgi:hypothetical protein
VIQGGKEEGFVAGGVLGQGEIGSHVADEGRKRGLHGAQAGDVARGECLLAHQLLDGLGRVGVGDHQRRVDGLAVLEDDAAHLTALDADPAHRAAQQQLAAAFGDRRAQRLRKTLKGSPAVESAVGDVAHQHRRVVQERDARRRQAEVGPERSERRLESRRIDVGVERLGERRAPVAQQGREAVRRRHHVVGARQLGRAARLLARVEALLQKLPQPLLLSRELVRVGARELLEIARRLHGEAGIDGLVAGIDALEMTAVAHLERIEHVVDHPAAFVRARLTATHQVNGRIEEVAAAPERVGVAADPIVALDHEDAPPDTRQDRGERQASDTRAHHDRVVRVTSRLPVECHDRAPLPTRPRARLIRGSVARGDLRPRARTSP